ncbi:hypothetical protein ACFFHM_06305 [Halalkalibacter kiskunsagensis]|uniref:Transposase n=1 Tax=Halalkalibacter kiskunsagensis TaxID=1548599 RepID=A0ABV6KA06_9BACI
MDYHGRDTIVLFYARVWNTWLERWDETLQTNRRSNKVPVPRWILVHVTCRMVFIFKICSGKKLDPCTSRI